MTIQIHGKSYKTVVERVNEFRAPGSVFENWSIETDILRFEGVDCIIKATIKTKEGRVVATGLAHEVQGSTNINKTSHVENCETSAIGRALAALGLAGTEYASGDEVGTAVINQAVKDALDKSKRLLDAVLQHHSSVMAIKQGIATGELSVASEAWFALDDEVKAALWLSPTSGGCFTTRERDAIKSTEFRLSHYGDSA
jgi:hypothetical protein